MDLKKPLTFEELAGQMQAHNLAVHDKSKAIDMLQKVSYYRLSGYLLQFRVSENDSDLQNVSFEDLAAIYGFDSELRSLLRKYIEIIEVYYRTQIAHWFSLARCIAPPHDQHYDENNFYRKQHYREVMEKYQQDKRDYYGDSLVMLHHDAQYGGHEPLWVITEILSFSNVSKLYSSMCDSDREKIAKEVGTSSDMLSSHLHCLTILRNKCAHAARLYNQTMDKRARLPSGFLKSNPSIDNNSLFAYIIVLLKRLPDDETKKEFIAEYTSLIKRYNDSVDMQLIGMPESFNSILVYNRNP